MDSASVLVKKCRVCGDRALAFNFNGLSCESCKAFFRRNCLRQELKQELSCLKGGKCEIDISTRKLCSRCRLDKCFSIGMKKELVMKNHEKPKKRERIIKPKEHIVQDEPHDEIRQFSSSEQDELNDKALLLDFGPFEQELFDEMKQASFVFHHKPCCAIEQSAEANPIQAFNLQETYIRMIVAFCKSIHAFHCLKTEDQLIVLRPFFAECFTIRCAYHYDVEQDGFPNEFCKTNPFIKLVLMLPPDKGKMLAEYRKFIYSMHNEIACDKNIRDLLITMALFRPKDNISCPEFIRYHYFVYCRLCLRYLEQKYRDNDRATQKYCKLMHLMDRMWHIREIIYDTCMDNDTRLVSHVLADIYHVNSIKIFDK